MSRFSKIKMAALAGVSVVALGAGGTLAQQVTDYDLSTNTADLFNYELFGLNRQFEDQPVMGTISGSAQQVTGPNDGANVSVLSNDFAVSATGNIATTTVVDNAIGTSLWGNRILSEQIVSGTVVSAVSTDNATGADVAGFLTGNMTISDNSITAGTTLNSAANSLDGLPSIDGAPVGGSVTGGFAAGNIVLSIEDAHSSIGNVQLAAGVTATAQVDGTADIDIGFLNTATGDISATLSVSDNAIGASLTGNIASNSVVDPVDVDYAGSVIVANGQANMGGTYTSQVVDQQIAGIVDGDATLSGVLAVSDNLIGADSSGNQVTNQIAFGDGVSVLGEGGDAFIDMSDSGAVFDVTRFEADFGIVSAQGNIGTGIDATVSNSGVVAYAPVPLAGGTMAVSGNMLEATAEGSVSANSITADGPEFSAAVAIAGFQMNSGSPVSALVDNGQVGATAGDLSLGAVLSVSDNTVDAAATGNQASSLIAMDVEDLDVGGGGYANIDGDASTDFGSIEGNFGAIAHGGVLATNLQSISSGSDVTADVTDTGVGLTALISNGSTVALDDNTINAAATGNESATTIQLSGVDGLASAGVGNVQISDALVSGTLTGATVDMALVSVTNSTVSLTDNVLSAGAIANTADNTLMATGFTTLTVGNTGFAYNPRGVFTVVSDQEVRQDVTATVDPALGLSHIVANVDGFITDSVVAIGDNTTQAAATGNQAGNTLWIDAVVLDNVAADSSDLIGRVANEQSIVGADVTASVLAHEIGLGFTGMNNSTLAITGNTALAAADGSFAANQLVVTGTTHIGIYDADASLVFPTDGVEFLVESVQASAAGLDDAAVTALVQEVGIGTVGSPIVATSTSLVVSDNDLVAMARSNVAINRLNLGVNNGAAGFSSLTTSALIDNLQTSEADVSATVETGQVGHDLSLSIATTQTVSNNTLDALALGNASDNRMNVAAVELNGGASEANDDFHVLNSQSNSGAIVSSVMGQQIGINAGGVGQEIIGGGSASVLNNGASAVGYGNNAGNYLVMASMDGDYTGGVSNSQVNGGAVTSSVTGLTVGMQTAGTTSANTTLAGNSVGATAVGNSAVNVVSRSNY